MPTECVYHDPLTFIHVLSIHISDGEVLLTGVGHLQSSSEEVVPLAYVTDVYIQCHYTDT